MNWDQTYHIPWDWKTESGSSNRIILKNSKSGISYQVTADTLDILSCFSFQAKPQDVFAKLKANEAKWNELKKNEFEKLISGFLEKRILTIPLYTTGPGTYIVQPFTVVRWLSAEEGLVIGNYCSIAREVLVILGGIHNYNLPSTYPFRVKLEGLSVAQDPFYRKGSGKIIIKNDVWIGARSMILGGVSIGNGAVVSAGSVVFDSVPDFAIVGGNPAKILGYRFPPETISALLEIAWWDWSQKKIRENIDLFSADVETFVRKFSSSIPQKRKQKSRKKGVGSNGKQLMAYIQKEIAPNVNVTPLTALLSTGIINSFKLMDILSFIEDTYGVAIPNGKVSNDNFDTVEQMIALIEKTN